MQIWSALSVAFGLGVITGLRSFSAITVVSWAAHLGRLDLGYTWLALLDSTPAVCVLTVLAVAELIGDKLPRTPSRKSPGPFIGRIILGALSGAAFCAAAKAAPAAGALLGALGGVAGTLGGYETRTRLVKALKAPDWVIAVIEDAIAIGGALLLVSRLA